MRQKLDCILLIDDDEPTNYLNKMILAEMECAHKIKVAQSCKEALAMMTGTRQYADKKGKCQPELIFLDINMPAMNGWEFIDLYKKNMPEKDVVMVMLTTSFNPEDKQHAEATTEISRFINKPLTKEAVQEVLDKFF